MSEIKVVKLEVKTDELNAARDELVRRSKDSGDLSDEGVATSLIQLGREALFSMSESAFSETDVNGTQLTVEGRPADIRFRLESLDGRESFFYASEAQAIMLANFLVPCTSWWNTAAIQTIFDEIFGEIRKARPAGATDSEGAVDEGLDLAVAAMLRVCRLRGVQLSDRR